MFWDFRRYWKWVVCFVDTFSFLISGSFMLNTTKTLCVWPKCMVELTTMIKIQKESWQLYEHRFTLSVTFTRRVTFTFTSWWLFGQWYELKAIRWLSWPLINHLPRQKLFAHFVVRWNIAVGEEICRAVPSASWCDTKSSVTFLLRLLPYSTLRSIFDTLQSSLSTVFPHIPAHLFLSTQWVVYWKPMSSLPVSICVV